MRPHWATTVGNEFPVRFPSTFQGAILLEMLLEAGQTQISELAPTFSIRQENCLFQSLQKSPI